MLILGLKIGETVEIAEGLIKIQLKSIHGVSRIRLAFDCPKDIPIVRSLCKDDHRDSILRKAQDNA